MQAATSAGYDFSSSKSMPIAAYARLNLLILLPYNGTVYPRLGFELGVLYRPSRFISRTVKTITRTR